MSVDKEGLRELIENNLFGEGEENFSLDDLLSNDKEGTGDGELSLEPQEEQILNKSLDIEDSFDDTLGMLNEAMDVGTVSSAEQLSDKNDYDNLDLSFESADSEPQPAATIDEHDEEEVMFEDEFHIPDGQSPDMKLGPLEEEEKIVDDYINKVEKEVEETLVINEPVYDVPKVEPKIIEEPVAPPVRERTEQEEYVNIRPIEFPELDAKITGKNFDLDFFANIPVKIDVYLGNTTISLREIYELTEGSVIELNKLFGEPLELKIGGQIIAVGEVVAVDNNYGIMLKEIVNAKK
ncbi:MAG: FliM/FliN family flagellar motor switch protein [Candidatus Margulisbacteria bacterium]|nr:FliM/FliN family flagellar motor switch protein [Candidatus Margulisiibacteriota bacterium]